MLNFGRGGQYGQQYTGQYNPQQYGRQQRTYYDDYSRRGARRDSMFSHRSGMFQSSGSTYGGYSSGYGSYGRSTRFGGLLGRPSYGSFNRYGSHGAGIGGAVAAAALGAGVLALTAGALATKGVIAAGKGLYGLVVSYRDKFGHEKEFQKLRHFDKKIKCVYDGSDVEFGEYMTSHGYACLAPYSAAEFIIRSKYGKFKVCVYLPGDQEVTGLGEDSEGEVILTQDDWFDALGVPEEHKQFYTKDSPLEFTVENLTAYFVAPGKIMVKPVNKNCVGILLKTDRAADVFREIAKEGTSRVLAGFGNAGAGTIVMVPDLTAFLSSVVVQKHWGSLNSIDPDCTQLLNKVAVFLDAGTQFDVETEDGLVCTPDYVIGLPAQKLPRAFKSAKRVVDSTSSSIKQMCGKVVTSVRAVTRTGQVEEPNPEPVATQQVSGGENAVTQVGAQVSIEPTSAPISSDTVVIGVDDLSAGGVEVQGQSKPISMLKGSRPAIPGDQPKSTEPTFLGQEEITPNSTGVSTQQVEGSSPRVTPGATRRLNLGEGDRPALAPEDNKGVVLSDTATVGVTGTFGQYFDPACGATSKSIGLLMKTQHAVDIIDMMNIAPHEYLKPGVVLLIRDPEQFFNHPGTKELWFKLNSIDPACDLCIEEIADRLQHHEWFEETPDNGITCTEDYMFGQLHQTLPKGFR